MNAVEFAQLIAEFGDLCLEVNESLVQHQLYATMQSIEQLKIQLVTGIRDEKQVAMPFTKSILQKPSNTFNPVGGAVDFVPRKWKLRAWAVDLQFKLREFNETFLMHYKSASRDIRESMDLAQYMLRMLLMQLKEDIEMAIWQGEYDPAAAAANVAEPLEVVDGFLKLITDAIAAGDIAAPVVTGAITNVNAVTAFEDMYLALGNKNKARLSYTYASYENVIKFISNYIALNGANNSIIAYVFEKWLKNQSNASATAVRGFEMQSGDFLPMIPLPISGGSNMIVPVWGMGNSNRLIIESRHNGGVMQVGMGSENDLLNLNSAIDIPNRAFNVVMDGSIATQIACFDINGETYLTANDTP